MKFVDTCVIQVRSGNGGAGAVAFHREKFVPMGGPSGGNGGRGGDVILVADPQLATLLDYQFKPLYDAQNGRQGEGKQRTGPDGEDLVLRLPLGTVVLDAVTGEEIVDLATPEQRFTICKGGRGGKGNAHFKSSTNQAPRYAQPGEEGQERSIRMELKLLADVGLVGYPNVGKSSLIANVSAARPKIADYPFTTLVPNLGVVQFGDQQHFVMADVPGLIVGAHEGKGLGTRFLRHVERVRVIAHLVTVVPEDDERDPVRDFEAIEAEMRQHNPALAELPRVLVLNRMDLPDVAEHAEEVEAFAKKKRLPFFAVSAATGAGMRELVSHLGEHVSRVRERDARLVPRAER